VLGIGPARVIRENVLPAGLPLIPMTAVLLAIRHFLAPARIPTIAAGGVAGALSYVCCCLAVPAPTGERVLADRVPAAVLQRRKAQ